MASRVGPIGGDDWWRIASDVPVINPGYHWAARAAWLIPLHDDDEGRSEFGEREKPIGIGSVILTKTAPYIVRHAEQSSISGQLELLRSMMDIAAGICGIQRIKP